MHWLGTALAALADTPEVSELDNWLRLGGTAAVSVTGGWLVIFLARKLYQTLKEGLQEDYIRSQAEVLKKTDRVAELEVLVKTIQTAADEADRKHEEELRLQKSAFDELYWKHRELQFDFQHKPMPATDPRELPPAASGGTS